MKKEEEKQCPQQQDQQEPLLRIKYLRTYFDTAHGVIKAVVDGVSLSIQPGEVVGLLGESGSGKITLGLSITILLPSPPARIVVDLILITTFE